MQVPDGKVWELETASRRAGGLPALCPVDRMPRRLRNQICIAVIAVGALNFLSYTVTYAVLGGDAPNGHRELLLRPDGSQQVVYFVRGHFLRSLSGREAQVSRGVWIYSYLHSLSVLLTSAAMIISMLVLARPHILATMREGPISGRTFVTAFGLLVVLVTAAALVVFVRDLLAPPAMAQG